MVWTGMALLVMGAAEPPSKTAGMVFIPPGECVLGTTEADAERLAKEYNVHRSLFAGEPPQRKVHVKAFYIDRFPVTNSQYQQFVDATRHRAPGNWNGAKYPADRANWPVTQVNWSDAHAYAQWAGKRLPTEVEWEKAARGPDGRRFPWGDEWDQRACRIDTGESLQTPLPLPVGCFPKGASPYGVQDLVGNVAQWTSSEAQASDPERGWAWYVIKGAACAHSQPFNFRCAARNFSAHISRQHSWLGFRCALDAAVPPTERHEPSVEAPQAPPAVPAAGPDASLYGNSRITVEGGPGHSARIFVPYFPKAVFGLNLPEHVGVADFPFGWSVSHTPIQWESNPERTQASYQCTFENRAKLTVTLKAHQDCVDFTLAIRNLSDRPFLTPSSNTCFNNHGAPYFEDAERARTFVWTDDGPVRALEMFTGSGGEPLHGGWTVASSDQAAPKGGSLVRHPLIAVRSRDHQWIVAQTYAQGVSVANNAHYTCLHTRPLWPDIPPGEERAVTGKLYFLKGGPNELLARWQRDLHAASSE